MMTVNVRRFGIGMIITLSSIIIIWTECYLHATEAMRNSNERPGIFDVSMMFPPRMTRGWHRGSGWTSPGRAAP
jgi:hypothetical protein